MIKSSIQKISKENGLMNALIISVFYAIDNFCKELKGCFEHYFIPGEKAASFEPPSALSLSEIMTVCVCFHLSGYKTFKSYYTRLIQKRYHSFSLIWSAITALWN